MSQVQHEQEGPEQHSTLTQLQEWSAGAPLSITCSFPSCALPEPTQAVAGCNVGKHLRPPEWRWIRHKLAGRAWLLLENYYMELHNPRGVLIPKLGQLHVGVQVLPGQWDGLQVRAIPGVAIV